MSMLMPRKKKKERMRFKCWGPWWSRAKLDTADFKAGPGALSPNLHDPDQPRRGGSQPLQLQLPIPVFYYDRTQRGSKNRQTEDITGCPEDADSKGEMLHISLFLRMNFAYQRDSSLETSSRNRSCHQLIMSLLLAGVSLNTILWLFLVVNSFTIK